MQQEPRRGAAWKQVDRCWNCGISHGSGYKENEGGQLTAENEELQGFRYRDSQGVLEGVGVSALKYTEHSGE